MGFTLHLPGPSIFHKATTSINGGPPHVFLLHQPCQRSHTPLFSGQTVFNPWAIIGGCATTTLTEAELVRADGLQSGDVLAPSLQMDLRAKIGLGVGGLFGFACTAPLVSLQTHPEMVPTLKGPTHLGNSSAVSFQ